VFRVLRLPRRVERQRSRHPSQALEREAETDDRERVDPRDHARVAVVGSVEADDVVAALVLRVGLAAELPAQREHPVLADPKPGAADRQDGAVIQRSVPRTAADPVARLEDDDLTSGIRQALRGGQSGKTGADDTNLGLAPLACPERHPCLPFRRKARPGSIVFSQTPVNLARQGEPDLTGSRAPAAPQNCPNPARRLFRADRRLGQYRLKQDRLLTINVG